MKVSIIIPTYRPQSWFEECIRSIYNQTFPYSDFEVIIILNGDLSFDSYVQNIMSKYSDRLNFVYFTSELGNVSNARNIGLDNARGEYILFVDSDDVISPNYMERLMQNEDIDTIVVSRSLCFNDDITKIVGCCTVGKRERNIIRYKSTFGNRKVLSAPWGKLIRRTLIHKNRFNISFQLGEDVLFWLSISRRIKHISLAAEDCIYYIRESRSDSLSRSRYKRSYLLKVTVRRNIEIIRIYFKHPFSNNFMLFAAKLLSSTRSFFRMMK